MPDDKVPRSSVPAQTEEPLLADKPVEKATSGEELSIFDKMVSNASKLDRLFYSSLKILVIILSQYPTALLWG